jgi:mono/diheme cytochrome c family protein
MQVKVVIGTIAFMLTMIILGFAALLEPNRLVERTADFQGRNIESGANIFQSACATCHGIDGKAEVCLDTAGEETGCIGRPLNHEGLLCGEPSQRMTELGWQGTKRSLIFTTISAGRPGTAMPTWSEVFGGPLYESQVNNVTDFVMNWEEVACPVVEDGATPEEEVEWPAEVDVLPEGDPGSGEALFKGTFGCVACHGDPAVAGDNAVGPDLENIGSEGETRVEGKSAMQYIYESILNPNEHIAPECPNGPCTSPSQMPNTFGERMDQQQMADIISYLMQQGGGE